MKQIENKFGSGALYEEHDLGAELAITCTGCLSLYAEALSWTNSDAVMPRYSGAKSHIVLGCQVTDLAVLNDLRTVERIQANDPQTRVYVSGCLARRFDIPLPDGVRRLENLSRNGTIIKTRRGVAWPPPFWLPEFNEADVDDPGHLFRHDYPLRIGVGCSRNCDYCTIRVTRGAPYALCSDVEFEWATEHGMTVVLVAESPTADQLRYWCRKAAANPEARLSIRNVEPHELLGAWDAVSNLDATGRLAVLHSPVQARDPAVLLDMKRPPLAVAGVMERLPDLRARKATNIIVDYKKFPNDFGEIYRVFDVVNWNPYWDGIWDRAKAEERFAKYEAQHWTY